MEPQTAALSAIPPTLRAIIERLGGGPKNYARVGSGEAMDAMIRDFNNLVAYRSAALIPEEIAALDGVIEGAVRTFYTSCRREVWWTARGLAQTKWWDRQTFEHLEAARRATGMTPPSWRLLRKRRDDSDLRIVATLCVYGDLPTDRWRRWWLDMLRPYVSMINIVTFPVSIPIAWIWRALRLRARSRQTVKAFRDRQRGRRTARVPWAWSMTSVYGFRPSSWDYEDLKELVESQEDKLFGPATPPQFTVAPPGWYPDPGQTSEGPLLERWWDGTAWTEHRRQGDMYQGWPPHAPGVAA
ncbi:DUF2510 domain-containing protein [Streptomyces sp. CA-251387]|uniref:DUF2510 domain-containing protein n=1 Tax=Streptomyces sp. CA-251387 TaxID=3240064 RepID=UPI003D8DB418